MTLSELQTRSHNLAREKGWWEGERDPDEVFALMHSEISEALEEWRTGRPITTMRIDTHRVDSGVIVGCINEFDLREVSQSSADLPVHGKPEGFMVELADLVIRIADATQAWGIELFFMEGGLMTKSVARLVCYLHEQIAEAQLPRDMRESLSMCVCSCFFFARQYGVDLNAVIDLKHQYNLGREKRHGGKIA